MKRAADEKVDCARKCPKIDEDLEKKILEVQARLAELEEECASEQLKVQLKFDTKKKEPFAQRGELLKKIPHFWKDCIKLMSENPCLYTAEEEDVLNYLDDVVLDDSLDKDGSHTFTFTFKENPYFKETKLSKQVKAREDGEPEIIPATITWTKKLQRSEDENAVSFFDWLQSAEAALSEEVEFGMLFRERVWEDVYNVYIGNVSVMAGEDGYYDDEEGELGEEEEGEEGEEGEEAEEGEEGEEAEEAEEGEEGEE